jgi:hypothetical protein
MDYFTGWPAVHAFPKMSDVLVTNSVPVLGPEGTTATKGETSSRDSCRTFYGAMECAGCAPILCMPSPTVLWKPT